MSAIGNSRKAANFTPLAMAAIAMLLILAVLPSALNLPQTNPTQTLEFAPVTDNEVQAPPAAGNLKSLGLGGSSSLQQSLGDDSNSTAIGKAIKVAGTKRCVGTPPRQTEDTLSPPCVATFDGDNFGNTYMGVTKDEIRVLYVFFGGTCRYSSRGRECAPTRKYVDLFQPPAADEDVIARDVRDLQNYFNDRYQTYGRRVHFWVYYTGSFTDEDTRAEATDNYNKIKPFAIVNGGTVYVDELARKGVLSFSSDFMVPAEYFRRYPKFIWSYLPAVEPQARSFSSMVCSQVVNRRVSFSGNSGENGTPRRLGLLAPIHEDWDDLGPGWRLFANTVKQQIEDCGGEFYFQGSHPNGGNINVANQHEDEQQFDSNMAGFKRNGVTTIIWAAGYDLGGETRAAARAGYFPEWISAGEGLMEGWDLAQLQDQSVMDGKAWIQTVLPRSPAFSQDFCFTAMREVNPSKPEEDAEHLCKGFLPYEAFRQLYTGIQVAGPRLGPTNVDRGYHAIPAGPSNNPLVPACYYERGDYTCIKDATAMWYDANSRAPGAQGPGCWRMPDQGKRYVPGSWPSQELSARKNAAADPCNVYKSATISFSF